MGKLRAHAAGVQPVQAGTAKFWAGGIHGGCGQQMQMQVGVEEKGRERAVAKVSAGMVSRRRGGIIRGNMTGVWLV